MDYIKPLGKEREAIVKGTLFNPISKEKSCVTLPWFNGMLGHDT